MIDWGTLPQELQKLWVRYSCDQIALEILAEARPQLRVDSPLEIAVDSPLEIAVRPVDSEADAEDGDELDAALDEESDYGDGASESLDGGVGRAGVSR